MSEASNKMDGSSFWVLDSTSSEIEFELNHQFTQKLKCKLPLKKGTLILEKDRILAGFMEGKLSNIQVLENPQKMEIAKELKSLKDSVPVLYSGIGEIVRMDLIQGGKQVVRTGYREPLPPGVDPKCTHLFQIKWEFADSALSFQLPSIFKPEKNKATLTANFSISYPDFGIFYKRDKATMNSPWQHQIPLKMKLVYLPFKGS
jgi:hypothetical protein